MVKAEGSDGMLVQVTVLVVFPFQLVGVFIVKAKAEAASRQTESMVEENMVVTVDRRRKSGVCW